MKKGLTAQQKSRIRGLKDSIYQGKLQLEFLILEKERQKDPEKKAQIDDQIKHVEGVLDSQENQIRRIEQAGFNRF